MTSVNVFNETTINFLNELHKNFNNLIDERIEKREEVYAALANGLVPDFSISNEVQKIKNDNWSVAPIPKELEDRRVEITGPPVRKMVINALNSGANVYMADFEDSNSPTWQNCLDGQVNLYDAVRRTIEYSNPNNGKKYSLNDKVAVLFVRPRGLHLHEKNYLVDGDKIRACLFDFGVYFSNNYQELLKNNSAPYFY